MRFFAIDSKKMPIPVLFCGVVADFGCKVGQQEVKVLKNYCL